MHVSDYKALPELIRDYKRYDIGVTASRGRPVIHKRAVEIRAVSLNAIVCVLQEKLSQSHIGKPVPMLGADTAEKFIAGLENGFNLSDDKKVVERLKEILYGT